MSTLVLVLLVLGVASAQNDAKLSLAPTGKCLPGRRVVGCTNAIPPICFCEQGPAPVPVPFPLPGPCICGAIHAPVCGSDGRTYVNKCEATCKPNVRVKCQGACPCRDPPHPKPPTGCICTADFNPVCGSDGKTYSNSCQAHCGGATVNCSGPCPCKASSPPSTPDGIKDFLKECVEKGELAAVAAASAACSTVELKCPLESPRLAVSGNAASLSIAQPPNPADALLEKVLNGSCLRKAENACRSNAFSEISDSKCRRLINFGPAHPGSSECSSVQDAVKIFNDEVTKLCKSK